MDPTQRFSNRAEDYAKYRPGYPDAAFDDIESRVDPSLPRVAADIGSGTGIFSRGLVSRGWHVHGVEPNAEMRAVAEQALASELRFSSHDARAEATGLPQQSVALVVAAQAFHWFDPGACQREWRRILVGEGLVCLVWNRRQPGSSFMNGYEAALSDGAPGYRERSRPLEDERAVLALFGGPRFERREVAHEQRLDWEGLRGRALSSSFVARPGEPGHEPLMGELRRLYEAHESGKIVRFDYVTTLYLGRLAAAG